MYPPSQQETAGIQYIYSMYNRGISNIPPPFSTFSQLSEDRYSMRMPLEKRVNFVKYCTVEDRIVVKYNLRNRCRIYVSLIMAPVRQFICVTEW